jgi:hypothetical protein
VHRFFVSERPWKFCENYLIVILCMSVSYGSCVLNLIDSDSVIKRNLSFGE